MEAGMLVAAGFNAHGQLQHSVEDDIFRFEPLKLSDSTTTGPVFLLFAGWSEIVYLSKQQLCRNGMRTEPIECNIVISDITACFGNHDGLLGALDVHGQVHMIDESRNQLVLQSQPDSPRIAHLAIAGNDRVAITFKQAPNARLTHIIDFSSMAHFRSWYQDPADEAVRPTKHHMLPGRAKQLIANATVFLCLTEAGDVYTWGDARYRSLGRDVCGGDAVPADTAGLVDALGGVKIVKISAGGWMAAALSDAGAAYLWGAGAPGTEHTIEALKETSSVGGVALVEITDEAGGEPLDVMDVAVGDGHVAVLVEGGRVFAAGENTNGQLGIGKGQKFHEHWVEVVQTGALATDAAPKSTFVHIRSPV